VQIATLQAQSYLYSVYGFTLTHHGAGRSIKSAAAYHWKEKRKKEKGICSHFLFRDIKSTRKQINHLRVTVGL